MKTPWLTECKNFEGADRPAKIVDFDICETIGKGTNIYNINRFVRQSDKSEVEEIRGDIRDEDDTEGHSRTQQPPRPTDERSQHTPGNRSSKYHKDVQFIRRSEVSIPHNGTVRER